MAPPTWPNLQRALTAFALVLAAGTVLPHASADARPGLVVAEGLGWLTWTGQDALLAGPGPCSERVAIQVTYTPAGPGSVESYVVAFTPLDTTLCRVGDTLYPVTAWKWVALPGSGSICTHSADYGNVSCDDGSYVSWSMDKFGNFDFHKEADSSHVVLDGTGTLNRLT